MNGRNAARYIAALIERIGELTIENHVLKEMFRNVDKVPVGRKWEEVLALSLQSHDAHEKRKEFAARCGPILSSLEDQEATEALLKMPTKGLPN
jgi:hypothetical protein